MTLTRALITQGLAAFAARRYKEAARDLEEAVQQQPRDQRLRGLYAVALAKSDRLEAAVEQAEICVSFDATSVIGYVRLGQVFLLAGRFNDAISAFETGLHHYPHHAALKSGHRAATMMFGQQQQQGTSNTPIMFEIQLEYNDKEDSDIRSTNESSDSDHEGGTGGSSKRSSSSRPSAVESNATPERQYDMVGLDPSFLGAMPMISVYEGAVPMALDKRDLGMMYLQRKQYEQALQHLDQALEMLRESRVVDTSKRLRIDDMSATIMLYQCMAMCGVGRHVEALALANRLVRSNPKNEGAYLEQARALLGLLRPHDALIALNSASRWAPSDVADRTQRAESRTLDKWRKRALQETASNLAAVRGPRPSDNEAVRAAAQPDAQHVDDAIMYLPTEGDFDALSLTPEQLNEKGAMLFAASRYDAALSTLEWAVEYEPDNHVYISNRSVSLCALGRLQEGLEDAERVLHLRPDYAKGWVRKGRALLMMQRPTEALETYTAALKRFPNDEELQRGKMQALREAAASLMRADATATTTATTTVPPLKATNEHSLQPVAVAVPPTTPTKPTTTPQLLDIDNVVPGVATTTTTTTASSHDHEQEADQHQRHTPLAIPEWVNDALLDEFESSDDDE